MHGCTQDNWNAECMKFAKYKLSAFFAWGTQSEPLPNPYSGDVPSVLLGGYVNRWLHGLYSKADVTQPIPDYDTRHWVGLLHSVKQVKRMAPRPDSHTVNLSLQSTFDRLTTPDEVDMFVDDPLYGCCPATFDPDAYGAQDWPWATPEDVRLYRSFAYFVHCQALVLIFQMRRFSILLMYLLLLQTIISREVDLGLLAIILSSLKISVMTKPWITILYPMLHLCCIMTLITNSHAKYLLMLEKAKEIWRRDMREVEGKMVPVAKFTAVIEALKVRGISKQSGGLFYLKPLQSALLRHLAKKRQFIVGKVETPENLLTAVGGIIDPMLKHLSVDYEASTDYLKSVFSRIASEVIFRDCHVGQVAREMWSKSLYGGAVTLSDEPDGDSDPKLIKKFGRERCGIKLQKRGQLMGNIMSFPILCLCSAFVLWKTQCFANRKRIHPCDGDFAVNGDDGYMQTTDRGYAYWKRIGTKLGLKPSVGKVYFSSSFFDFNSSIFGSWQPTVIYPSGVFGPGPLRLMRFRFLPIGLAYGTMRTGSVMVSEMLSLDALSKGKSAGSIVRCILSLAEHKQRLRVWDVVYRKLLYVPSIYSKIRGIPWFLPESVGGLGLPPAYRRPIQSS